MRRKGRCLVPSRAAAVGRWRRLLGHLVGGSLLLGVGCAAPTPAGPAAGPPAGAAPAGAAPAGAAASPSAAGQSGGALASPTAPEVVKVAASVSVSATGFFIGVERGYF